MIDNPKYCENENNSAENSNLRKYKEHLKLSKRKHKQDLIERKSQMHPPYKSLQLRDTDQLKGNYKERDTSEESGSREELGDNLQRADVRPVVCSETELDMSSAPTVRGDVSLPIEPHSTQNSSHYSRSYNFS